MKTTHKSVLAAGIAAAVLGAPIAIGAGEGNAIRAGERNPAGSQSRELRRTTEIIGDTSTYVTRQSNKSDNGGGAIYGCRSDNGGSDNGKEPCIRANNLAEGLAFEFEADGRQVGEIEVTRDKAGDSSIPFTTNATGVARGLNADRVDGLDALQMTSRYASVRADGSLQFARLANRSARVDEGAYTVGFLEDLNQCAASATITSEAGGFAWAVPPGSTDATLAQGQNTVRVFTAAPGGQRADRAFHLTLDCNTSQQRGR